MVENLRRKKINEKFKMREKNQINYPIFKIKSKNKMKCSIKSVKI